MRGLHFCKKDPDCAHAVKEFDYEHLFFHTCNELLPTLAILLSTCSCDFFFFYLARLSDSTPYPLLNRLFQLGFHCVEITATPDSTIMCA